MTTVLTPYLGGDAIELGNAWEKRLLPIGEVAYKGRTLKFTAEYLQGLAASFRDQAYDQVPFQLAGDDNSHTNAVERFAGRITDASVRDDGLWITVEPTDRGQQLLTENPMLGASARIVEDYDRSDGRFFPAAIQHVLATHDPRIPALGPWQAIEASNPADMTIDLSQLSWAGEPALEMASYLLDEQPWEVAAVDQVIAEISEMETEAAEYGLDFDTWATISDPDNAEVGELADDAMAGLELSNDGKAGLADAMLVDFGRRDPEGHAALIELSQKIEAHQAVMFSNESRRQEEDAMRPSARASRPSAEDRLAASLERIRTGSYLPSEAFAFSNGSQREILLSGLRDSQTIDKVDLDYGMPCGSVDAMGRCGAPYHDLHCGTSALVGEATAEGSADDYKDMLRFVAEMPATDYSDGTFTDFIEADHGQALRGGGDSLRWAGAPRREGWQPERTQVHQYSDDPDSGRHDAPDRTRAMVAAVQAQDSRLTSGVPDRMAVLADRALRMPQRPVRHRPGGDNEETMAERAERYRSPGRALPVEDELFAPVSGSLRAYTR